MSKQKNIPQLRFPEFEGEWVEKKFGSIFSFRSTNSFSRENLNYNEGYVKNIHYGDIHKKFKSIFIIQNEEVPFINSEIDISKINEDNYCKVGDLIIADASEDYADIGKSIEIFELSKQPVLAGLHTILARPDLEPMQVGFSSYLMKSDEIRNQIKKQAQGTKVLSISATRLSTLNISLPTLSEQQKIASFFMAIDSKLDLLRKKRDLLEKYKKGVMQKIFSQKIRFKDENGNEFADWEEKNGNKLFDSVSDRNHNSDLPILAITQDKGAIPRDMIDYKISVTDKSIETYKVVQKGDFIISLRSFQGGIEYSSYCGICSPAYIVLRPREDICKVFYKYYLKTEFYIKQLNQKLEGIRDGKMISYKYFSDILLPVPSLPEQKKIANFLSSIDTKIENLVIEIEGFEKWKKGLLGRMFC